MKIGQAPVFHIENSYASGRKKRPRGPRSTPIIELARNLDVVPQRPLVDLKSQAITYFLYHHLQTPENVQNISRSVSDDFLPVWNSGAECQMLDLAVSSMALATYSQTQRHLPAAIEASVDYQKLLQIAQVTTLFLTAENIDACLLAIFFMSRYEDAVHRPSQSNLKPLILSTLQSFSHHDGALAVLKFWRDRLSRVQPATEVIKHTRRGLIRSAILRTLALPEWMMDGAIFGECGLELKYDCIFTRTVNVRKKLFAIINGNDILHCTSYKVASRADDLNQEVQELDKAVKHLTAYFPSTWYYQRHTLPEPHPWPIRDFYSPVVYSYSSPAYAAVWNQYYAMRMLISSTQLRILELSRPNSTNIFSEQRLECFSNMNAMANDLASSVPFCLQRIKVTASLNSSSDENSITLNTNEDIKPYMARLLVWPLSIASTVAHVGTQQKSWFRSEIARLGRIAGARVLECAETDEWLEI